MWYAEMLFVTSGQDGVWCVVCRNVHSRRQQSVELVARCVCGVMELLHMLLYMYICSNMSAMPACVACIVAVCSDLSSDTCVLMSTVIHSHLFKPCRLSLL